MAKKFGDNGQLLTDVMGHFIKYSKVSSTRQLIGWMLIIFIAVGGCATSSTREEQKQYNEIVPAASVVVVPIGNRSDNVADCVQSTIQFICPNLHFFPHEKFVDSLFPWFEPSTFPESKEDLDALLKNRLVQARLDKLGVRYVISIYGETVQSEYDHTLPEDWAEILGRGAYFILIEANRRTDIYASVIDLKEARLPLKAESHKAKTRRYAGWFLIIPLYIQPAITEIPACNEIGKKIAKHLSGCDSTVDKEVEY
jgi:hypothetical protein